MMSSRARAVLMPVTAGAALMLAAPVASVAGQAAGDTHFSSDSVRISVPGAILAGRLHLPLSSGPHPAVVLLPGARESRFLPGVADHLARQGIAVLDLDKRGVGASTGRWDRQSFQGRAADAVAAMDFLRTHPDVDPDLVGLVGHSQGGWIAQMVAAQEPGVAFVVLLAGPAQTVRDQILTYERLLHERRGRSPGEVESAVAGLRRHLNLAAGIRPVCSALRMHYICRIIDFDPASYIARLTVPVLAVFGEVDPMVPPELNIPLLCAGLTRAGNDDVTVHVFPGANHDFYTARTGLPEEHPELEHIHVPGFLELISDWIADRTHAAASARSQQELTGPGDVCTGRP